MCIKMFLWAQISSSAAAAACVTGYLNSSEWQFTKKLNLSNKKSMEHKKMSTS